METSDNFAGIHMRARDYSKSPSDSERPLQPLPPRRAVLGNAILAQQPIDAQPSRPFRRGQQIRQPTAPGKTLQGRVRRQQLRAGGIQMHVIANALEGAAARAIEEQRLVASGEEMTKQFVPLVEAAGVSAEKPFQPFHPGNQIRLRRLDHQMKMIGHEDVGVNLPTRLETSLAQRLDEALAI